ncbi:helix-turn-helix domain-containing protein [Leeia oryzae]|uniref:helix-turn-helix domain-containing protein n=1 Tax=Leeia oryzae TaxID=356662 RepID=UPI000A052D02
MTNYYTPQTLAEYLNISPQTIYNRLSSKGSLPVCTKIGKLLRFSAQDVEEWLEAQREVVKPIDFSIVDQVPRRRGRPTKAEQIRRGKIGNA